MPRANTRNSRIKYMCQLFETILIEKGVAPLLHYHQARVNLSRQKLFGSYSPLDLSRLIASLEISQHKSYRCRVDYSIDLIKIEIRDYIERNISIIAAKRAEHIEYPYKFADRKGLDAIRSGSSADEVIIVKRNLVTDSTTANLVFSENGKLFTPNSPLLNGIRRQSLLDQGIIEEREITYTDLSKYEMLFFINALRPLKPELGVPVHTILPIKETD